MDILYIKKFLAGNGTQFDLQAHFLQQAKDKLADETKKLLEDQNLIKDRLAIEDKKLLDIQKAERAAQLQENFRKQNQRVVEALETSKKLLPENAIMPQQHSEIIKDISNINCF